MEEAVVGRSAEAKNADIAGNAGPIRTGTEAHQGQDHPQEGACPAASGPQGSNSVHPGNPKSHVVNLRMYRIAVSCYQLNGGILFPMKSKRESEITLQIEKVKRDLAGLGELRPGSLSTQYTVCGSPGCRFKATPPQKHGPYNQLSFTRKARSITTFVRTT